MEDEIVESDWEDTKVVVADLAELQLEVHVTAIASGAPNVREEVRRTTPRSGRGTAFALAILVRPGSFLDAASHPNNWKEDPTTGRQANRSTPIHFILQSVFIS